MNAPPHTADAAAFLAAIVDSSDDAIVGKSLDGVVLSWNSGAERVFGWTAAQMIGRSVRALIPADRQREEDMILASIARGERVPTFETVRSRNDGTAVTVAVTVSPVRDASGAIIGASKIARDIGEQRRVRAQLEDSERRFRMLADNMSQLAWIADRTGALFWYNQRWFEYTGTTLEQMRGWGWSAVHHPDEVERVEAHYRACLQSGEPWEDSFPLRSAAGEYRWFLSRAIPVRDAQGDIAYWFGTNTDVTAMRDAERRIELLMMEVNHRSKNMLAVIQAMARRSAAQGGDFVGRLELRIQAIAANQDVLVRHGWSDVPLADVVRAQCAVCPLAHDRTSIAGLDIAVSPSGAESIAMALHELLTNAVHYGALSEPDGHVAISWTVEPDDIFVMTWAEGGGPRVAEPERRGFGSRVIADVPSGKLGGEASITYPPEGLRWTLRCPLANLSMRASGFGTRREAR